MSPDLIGFGLDPLQPHFANHREQDLSAAEPLGADQIRATRLEGLDVVREVPCFAPNWGRPHPQ